MTIKEDKPNVTWGLGLDPGAEKQLKPGRLGQPAAAGTAKPNPQIRQARRGDKGVTTVGRSGEGWIATLCLCSSSTSLK